MAQDIAKLQVNPLTVISSPGLRRLRRISMGTVQHPGQAPIRYLAGGSKLTDEQRGAAKAMLAQLQAALLPPDEHAAAKERLALVTKMLMAKPIASASQEAGRARGEAYQAALEDVPPWAIAEAIRLWHRGECGEHNYDWAPNTAILRRVAMAQLEPVRAAVDHIEGLLVAVSIDEAIRCLSRPGGRELPESVRKFLHRMKTLGAAADAARIDAASAERT
jgi:hypothetical protein